MTRLQPREPGSYFTEFSVPVPDIRHFGHVRTTVTIHPRSTNVYVEPEYQISHTQVQNAARSLSDLG